MTTKASVQVKELIDSGPHRWLLYSFFPQVRKDLDSKRSEEIRSLLEEQRRLHLTRINGVQTHITLSLIDTVYRGRIE